MKELGVTFRSDDGFWLGPRLTESSAAAALPIELDLLWWGYKTTGLVVLASMPAVSLPVRIVTMKRNFFRGFGGLICRYSGTK